MNDNNRRRSQCAYSIHHHHHRHRRHHHHFICPKYRLTMTVNVSNQEVYSSNRERNMENKINKMIDVFHRRCVRSILGISWRDHITNDEVMARYAQMALHDSVATRRRRFVGHILRLPTTRPASLALEWIPGGGSDDQGGHGKTH